MGILINELESIGTSTLSGNTEVHGELIVHDYVTFHDRLTVQGDLIITGNTMMGGSITVVSTADFSAGLWATDMNVGQLESSNINNADTTTTATLNVGETAGNPTVQISAAGISVNNGQPTYGYTGVIEGPDGSYIETIYGVIVTGCSYTGTTLDGTSGTSGTSGDPGVSGTDGTSGTSGDPGVSGTSGTSGGQGIDGKSFLGWYRYTGVTEASWPVSIDNGCIMGVKWGDAGGDVAGVNWIWISQFDANGVDRSAWLSKLYGNGYSITFQDDTNWATYIINNYDYAGKFTAQFVAASGSFKFADIVDGRVYTEVNGVAGAAGASGTSGDPGTSGTSGVSAYSIQNVTNVSYTGTTMNYYRTSGTTEFYFPSCSASGGYITIKNISGTLTVYPDGSETIDYASSKVMNANDSFIFVDGSASNWDIT